MKEQGRACATGHESEVDVSIGSESSLKEHGEQRYIFDQASSRQIPLIVLGFLRDRPIHLPHLHQPQYPKDAMLPGFIPTSAPLPTFPNVTYAISPPAYIVNRDSKDVFR